jgi:hypothetical protein
MPDAEEEIEDPPPDMPALRAALTRILRGCPACGASQWSLPEGTNMVTAGENAVGKIDFGTGFSVVAAICETCGYVSLHHAERLLTGADPEAAGGA